MNVDFDELSLSESPAVTAFSMPGDRTVALGAGFDGHISKPIDLERFVEQIEAYLRPNCAPGALRRLVDRRWRPF